MGRGFGCKYLSDARLQLAPGMEIGYVVKDAKKWEVNTERDASDLDVVYYGKLLGKAWDEVAFVLQSEIHD
jgi:hypothetical protein